ncbi:MAG TPA: phosphatidylserine decarboxylase [Eudoraea sp.]|nr:phosphatidylserine decarboxylase [Eudoraea sp.]
MKVAESTSYYSDPHFTLSEIPQWKANLYRFLSVNVWGNLPSPLQRSLSALYAASYDQPITKRIIRPYIQYYYKDPDYLSKFRPPGNKSDFQNFQDFFIRKFAETPKNHSPFVWPCEGLLCDTGNVNRLGPVRVKCDTRSVTTIFGMDEGEIPGFYHFTNVFLHNKNYHRIHAPVGGKVSRIQHIPGDLVVLRPWIYKQNPSLPAFRNERFNVDITDSEGRVWYLSIVGGPAVGTIKMADAIAVGSPVEKLEELALFYLGSTCCMAAPRAPRLHTKNSFVEVGATY